MQETRTHLSKPHWKLSPPNFFLDGSQDWLDNICDVNWKDTASNKYQNEAHDDSIAIFDTRVDTSSSRSKLNDSIPERKDQIKEYFNQDCHTPRCVENRDLGLSLFNGTGRCKQGKDKSWLPKCNTIRASGMWNVADDTSIHSETFSCGEFSLDESMGVMMLKKEKADLSTLGDDDSTCCSNDSKEEHPNITIDIAQECTFSQEKPSSPKFPKGLRSNEACSVFPNEKRNDVVKGVTLSLSDDLSKQIKSKLPKGKASAEKVKKALMKKLRMTISSRGRYHAEVGKSLVDLSDFHQAQDQIDISIVLQKEALCIWYACYGDFAPITIETKVKIGKLFQEQGNNNEALNMYCQALRVKVEIDDSGDISASDIRILMAEILDASGRTKDAIKEMKRALKGYRAEYGDEHVKVASSVEKIAAYYLNINSYSKANAIYGELVKLRVSLHGSQSLEVGKSLVLWAKTFEKLGDINKSMKLLKQGYIILHENKAVTDVDDACALKAIGDLYKSVGSHEKAIKAYSSSLLIYRRSRGESHPDTAESYVVLGVALRAEKNFEKALKALNRSIMVFGGINDNLKYVKPMTNALCEIGITYKLMGKYQQSLKVFFREHFIRKKKLPDEEYYLGRCIRNIGLVYFNMKKYDSAENFLTESLLSFDRSIGRNVEFAETLHDCARVLEEANKNNEAVEAYIDTLSILKANGKSRHDEAISEIMKVLITKYSEVDLLESNRATTHVGLIDKK